MKEFFGRKRTEDQGWCFERKWKKRRRKNSLSLSLSVSVTKPADTLSPREQDPDPAPVHRRRRDDRHVEELVRVAPDVKLAGRPPLWDPRREGGRTDDIKSAHGGVVRERLPHRRLVSSVEHEAVQGRGEAPGAQGREEHRAERAEARGLEELEQGHAGRRRSERDGRPEVEVAEERVALEAVDDLERG